MLAFCTQVWAKEYRLVVPNPPGSSSDTVARAIAEEYSKISGNTLLLDYVPGADQVIAATKFQGQKEMTVILGTTTMHVFNHVYKENLAYGDRDFEHVGWIGWTPHVWYVRAESRFQTLDDAIAHARQTYTTVGVDGLSTQVNVLSLQKFYKYPTQTQMIIYKGSPQTLADLLGGHIDIAVSSLSAAIVSQAEAGKIRILATTNENPITIAGRSVIAAHKKLNLPQFNGGFLLSIKPGDNSDEARKLKADLLQSIRQASVKEKLSKINIDVDGRDGDFATKNILTYRDNIRKLK